MESLGAPFLLQEFKLARHNLPAMSPHRDAACCRSLDLKIYAAIYSNWYARLYTPLSKFNRFVFQFGVPSQISVAVYNN